METCVWPSNGSLRDGLVPTPHSCRAAGYERRVTAETVSMLCEQGQLVEVAEALGVLVQTECLVSHSLLCTVLSKCGKDAVLGRRVHALIVRNGSEADTFLCNHILRMYDSHAMLQEAMDVFRTVANPDSFTWSAIISAHVKHRQDREAIQLYHQMRRSSVKPDAHVFVAALQACARGAVLEAGQLVHADVLATGVEPGLFVSTGLVDMYAKCGSLEDAQRVFDGLGGKNVVTWTALISGYSQHGMGQEALRLYSAMQQEGIAVPTSVTFVSLLQACAGVGASALEKGKQLHGEIGGRGLQADVAVANSLVNMYAKCGSLKDAQGVFDGLPHKDVVTWNAMIAGYSQQGMGQEAFRLYEAMEQEGITAPTAVTFVCLLQACAAVGTPALEKGKELHAHIGERGLQADIYVANSLINMYAKCGSLEEAQRLFDEVPQRDVVTWNAMIAGYSHHGMGGEALCLYNTMQEEGIAAPNAVSFVCLLQACVTKGYLALEKGRQLHAQIRDLGLEGDVIISNGLVSMYAKCGSLEEGERVFHKLSRKDVVTWNAMIAGYSQQGMGQEALHLYTRMHEENNAAPDAVTFVCLLQACATMGVPALQQGKQLHLHIEEQGLQADVYVANSLVNMYAKCGSMEDAQGVFDGLGQKTVVSWNAMITGYSQQGMGQEALRLYRALQEGGTVVPSSVTFVCVLQACANVAALHVGRELHAQIEQQGVQGDALVALALINMYARSGSMVHAQQVFEAMLEKDIGAWNALIAGYSRQGDSEVVFNLFHRMRRDGVQPDSVTFLCLLRVCSHVGLVEKGREHFEAMSRKFAITPTMEHYTCMVDLLGRAGRLDEALALVRTMPFQPDVAVWHTLLAACRKWGNLEVGRHAFEEAVKLDEMDPAAYVLMSNIYTSSQMLLEAQEMQAKRTRIGAWKQAGQSWWTDMDGLVHSFFVGDQQHPEGESIYATLKQLVLKIEKDRQVLHSGNIHDERIATARNRLCTQKKNLEG